MICLCGLSREDVLHCHDSNICLVVNQRCQNYRIDGSEGVCNELLASHPPTAQVASTGSELITTIDITRKRRWDGLNKVLDNNRKAIKRDDGIFSLGYSYATWEQVREYFPITQGNVSDIVDDLPSPSLNALHQYLSFATSCFGSITEGREAKRVHFIAPVIIIVCAFFNGDIQILAEEDISGARLHAHGHFEFVLKRQQKRICIVEAKKDDILQGKTQSLIGCESLCDVENIPVSYGISTNFLNWCFLKNEADKITEELLTISLEQDHPTVASLKIIANKIIAILK